MPKLYETVAAKVGSDKGVGVSCSDLIHLARSVVHIRTLGEAAAHIGPMDIGLSKPTIVVRIIQVQRWVGRLV